MKLIHLSDLHLGKRVNEFPMLEDQAYILEQILAVIDRQAPDAVLIAGDGVYAFARRGIGRYMLMLDHFVFFDFDEPIIFFIADYVAVMGLFVFIGHYSAKYLRQVRKYTIKDNEQCRKLK